MTPVGGRRYHEIGRTRGLSGWDVLFRRKVTVSAGGARSSGVEADPLGEGKVLRVVNGVGGAAHVGLPGVGAGLAAAAGLLFAPEGATDFGAAGADVDVGDAAVRA